MGWNEKLPEALSPQTLQATKVFVLEDEFDELESATDDVAALLFDDDVGENGWTSAKENWGGKILIQMSLVMSCSVLVKFIGLSMGCDGSTASFVSISSENCSVNVWKNKILHI